MTDVAGILRAVATYADAYAGLQVLQEKSDLIPEGDQKTGCIGEFYARLYLRARYPDAIFRYGSLSEKGWDVDVTLPERTWRIQVKAVSAFARKRRLSPIHHGWHELYVLYLGRTFQPLGFWVIADPTIVPPNRPLKGCACPIPGNPRSGSKSITFGPNQIEEFDCLWRSQISAAATVAATIPARP